MKVNATNLTKHPPPHRCADTEKTPAEPFSLANGLSENAAVDFKTNQLNPMTQPTAEEQAQIDALMQSKTMTMLIDFGADMAVNTKDPNEFKAVLKEGLIHLIDALDNQRITFSNTQDEAYLLGVLAAIFDYITQ